MVLFLLFPTSLAAARALPLPSLALGSAATDTIQLRIRISNTSLGAVQVSAANESAWQLVARVVQPAIEVATSSGDLSQGVKQTSADCMQVVLRKGAAIRVLPAKAGPTPRDVLSIGPPSAMALLDALCRLGPVEVALEVGGQLLPVHDGFAPSDGDVLVIRVAVAQTEVPQAKSLIAEAGRRYAELALERTRQSAQKPVSGYLTVIARSSAEPHGGPVVFLLDGSPVAIVNRTPYTVRWDTRDWTDGEHLIEARALNSFGTVVSMMKKLVYVQNGAGDGRAR